jgi:heme A synthase
MRITQAQRRQGGRQKSKLSPSSKMSMQQSQASQGVGDRDTTSSSSYAALEQQPLRTAGGERMGWFKTSHYGVMILLFVVLLAIVIILWVASQSDAQIACTVLITFVAILYICEIVLGVPTYSGFERVTTPQES